MIGPHDFLGGVILALVCVLVGGIAAALIVLHHGRPDDDPPIDQGQDATNPVDYPETWRSLDDGNDR